jgi:hypothetical protein
VSIFNWERIDSTLKYSRDFVDIYIPSVSCILSFILVLIMFDLSFQPCSKLMFEMDTIQIQSCFLYFCLYISTVACCGCCFLWFLPVACCILSSCCWCRWLHGQLLSTSSSLPAACRRLHRGDYPNEQGARGINERVFVGVAVTCGDHPIHVRFGSLQGFVPFKPNEA